jgi:hypothetical protein
MKQSGNLIDRNKQLADPRAGLQKLSSRQLWLWLLVETEKIARKEVRRLRWRGHFGGTLPEGYDADSLAAESVAQLFKCSDFSGADSPAAVLSYKPLQRELQRRVRNLVDRLHHRKETFIFRREADLARVRNRHGETLAFINTIPAPEGSPVDILIREEEEAALERFKIQFNAFLIQERRLQKLFACFCQGLFTPKDLGRKLKLSAREVDNDLKRLRRKLAEFLKQPLSPRKRKKCQKSSSLSD